MSFIRVFGIAILWDETVEVTAKPHAGSAHKLIQKKLWSISSVG